MSEAQTREWIDFQDMARPDGIGCFEADGRMVRFFLEYDTGTESQQLLVDKIQRYEKMATDLYGIVLFWLHSGTREKTFHRVLARYYAHREPPFVIATGSRDQGDPDSPAGAVWTVYGAARGHAAADSASWRVRLAELPERGPREHWPSLLDMPLTEAAMPKPTFHQLRYGMTADQMQAHGLDPATGRPNRQTNDEPEWDDDYDNEAHATDTDHAAQSSDDGLIVRSPRVRSSGNVEPPRQTAPRRTEYIDVDTGRPISPTTRPQHQPQGPQGQPWPAPRPRT
jgi:hypothetical protein